MSYLTACYDLACSPPTYDIVAFLCEVELERLRRGCDDVEVHILPGPREGFREDTVWPFTTAEREALLHQVAGPICWLLPSVRRLAVLSSRDDAPEEAFGVGRALHGTARQVAASAMGCRPLRARYAEGKRRGYVSVTLRECRHWPQRNSYLSAWLRVAKVLQAEGWNVWLVRDTRMASTPLLCDVQVCPRASTDVLTRARLYEECVANLFVAGGPASLCAGMDAPLLMFRPACEALEDYNSRHLQACGIEPGGQIPGTPPWQRLIWLEDNENDVLAAFHAYARDVIAPELRPDGWD